MYRKRRPAVLSGQIGDILGRDDCGQIEIGEYQPFGELVERLCHVTAVGP